MKTFDKDSLQKQLWSTQAHFRLNNNDFMTLVEAFRRYSFLNKGGEALNKQWVGLGTPSKYSEKYFKCTSDRTPRINHWFTLTDNGVKVVQNMVDNIKLPKDKEALNEMNDFLFTFQ